MRKIIFRFIVLIFMQFEVTAQDLLTIPRIDNVDFDGNVTEEEWAGIPTLQYVQHQPIFGKEPTERTDVYFAYDAEYIYLAGRMYYKNPDDMQNTSKQRDAMDGSTEYFGLIIDTFNDNENALAFFTTPSGLRWDATVFNDAEGEFPVNLSWNTFWDVKIDHTDYGWQTEIRIPFTSLRFQSSDGAVKMGLISWRYLPHLNEVAMYPPVQNNLGPWASWKPSRMKKIIFENINPLRPVYLAPYALAGNFEEYELNDNETEYKKNKDIKIEAGLDLKYSLTTNLTMDLTLNPDFAQVEVDDQQVNLTRFSLFFPEKRLFFQERSSVFAFNTGGPNTLFYSRRIGLEEDRPVRIYGGARLVGRIGGVDLGFLNMQTAGVNTASSTNFGVLRARKQVINQFTYVGAMVTNKIDVDGNYNTGVGLDGVFRLSTNDYMNFNFAQTFYNSKDINPLNLTNSKLGISFTSRINKGFGYDISYSRVGADYLPEMGFELRENYFRMGDRVWWAWIPGEESKLLNHKVYFQGWGVWKNATNLIESAQIGPGWQFNSKKGFFGDFSVTQNHENIIDTFELSDDVYIPIEKYKFNSFQGIFVTPWNYLINVENMLTIGEFFDGAQLVAGISPGWRVNSSLTVGANYFYNRIHFENRDQTFIAHLLRFRSTIMFSTKLSTSFYIQYNSAEQLLSGNFRFRYNPSEGNDLYIVYNSGVNTERGREIPGLPFQQSQSFIIKYTYTFVLSK